MEKSEAIAAVHDALDSGEIQAENLSAENGTPSCTKPDLYLFDISLSASNHVIRTIRGQVPFNKKDNNLADPPKWAFFIDWLPNANWEHACSYVYVHESGELTNIAETAPPTQHSAKLLKRLNGIPANHQ